MTADDLNGYLRAKEPGMREKAYAWKTAIGLQNGHVGTGPSRGDEKWR